MTTARARRARSLLGGLAVLTAAVVLGAAGVAGGPEGSGHHRAAAPDAPRDLGRYALADNTGGFFGYSVRPPAPSNVSAVAHDRSALVSWSAAQPRNSRVVSYRVYVDGVQKVQVPASQRSVTVSGLTNYQQQKVTVHTVDDDDSSYYSESSDSAVAYVTPFDDVAPSAVTGLVATRGDGQVTLTWEPESGVESDRAGVRVYVDGALKDSVPAATTTYTATGLTNDRQYSFYLVAYDARPSGYGPAGSTAPNTSAPSTTVRATPTDLTPPSAPTNFTAVRGDTTAALTWTRPPESDLAGYGVVDENGALVTSFPATATSGTLTGLTNGRTYRLRLVAVDNRNNTSAPSTEVSVTPATPPAARTGLAAAPGDTTVRLTWSAPTADPRTAAAATVRVLVNGAVRTTIGGTTTSLTVTGLTNGTKYTFSLVAVDTEGRTSPESNRVEATPKAPPPSAPTNFTAVRGDTTATLSWTRPPENSLDRYGLVDENGNVLATYPASATSATLSGLTNGRTYRLRLFAADSSNTPSPPSTEVSVTPATPPAARTGLAATPGDTTVRLTWDSAVTDARTAAAATIRVLVDGAVRTSAAGTATSLTVTGLTNDVQYTFSLVAVDTEGRTSPESTRVEATPIDSTPPSAPTAFTAVRGDTTAAPTWTAPPENDVEGYLVLAEDGTTLATVTAPATSTTLSGLTNGATYRLRLVAVDARGNRSSPASVAVTPLAPPLAITGLSAAAQGSEVDLTWDAPASAPDHADAVQVQVWLVGSSDRLLDTVPASQRSYRWTDHPPGSTESFYVVALDADPRPSPRSAVVSTGLAPPQDVAATVESGRTRISWAPVEGASTYRVERTGTDPVTVVGTTAETFLDVTGLTDGTTYTFRVVAVDGDRTSAPSVEVAVTPLGPPAVVQGLRAERQGPDAVLSWTAPPAPPGGTAATARVQVFQVGTPDALVTTVDATTTTVTVPGGATEPPPSFYVVALDARGRPSAPSASVSVWPPPPTTVPAAGSGGVAGVAVSRDGRWVVAAVPATAAGRVDLVRIDQRSAERRTVAAGVSTGQPAQARAAVSDDGRYVALITDVSHDERDQNERPDVYRYDVTADAWALVSAPAGASPQYGTVDAVPGLASFEDPSGGPQVAITADGARVLFLSTRSGLVTGDTDTSLDLFSKDVGSGVVTRITAAGDLRPAGTGFAVAAGGGHVLYATGSSGSLSLVRQDLVTGERVLVTGAGGDALKSLAGVGQMAISADGRRVVGTRVDGTRVDGAAQVLVQADLTSPTPPPSGGTTSTPRVVATDVVASSYGDGQVALSPQGGHAFLITKDALVPTDTNGHVDAYRVDLVDPSSRVLVTAGPDGGPAVVSGESASASAEERGALVARDADHVVVVTQRPLIAADANALRDAYAVDLSAAGAGRVRPLVGGP